VNEIACGNSQLEYYLAGLSSLVEVRNLAEKSKANHKTVDVLINVVNSFHYITFISQYLVPSPQKFRNKFNKYLI